ncbi:hypothetical protein FOXYSP1_13516 [Fusarium oxysporum f. sp. phaseoli]
MPQSMRVTRTIRNFLTFYNCFRGYLRINMVELRPVETRYLQQPQHHQTFQAPKRPHFQTQPFYTGDPNMNETRESAGGARRQKRARKLGLLPQPKKRSQS